MKAPVFSVIIQSFNQKDFILEALESVYYQDYKNIELIVADDHSTDGSVNLISKWINKNRRRFVNVVFLVSEKNEGVSSNTRKGLKAANGEFVKYIGGDDLLLPNSISKMVEFLKNNSKAMFGVAKAEAFVEVGGKKKVIKIYPEKRFEKYLKAKNSIEQFRALSRGCFIPGPITFFRKEIFEMYGYPDDRYRWYEDWYMWLKFTLHGEKIYYFPEKIVKFRRHSRSLSSNPIVQKRVEIFMDNIKVWEEFVLPNLRYLRLVDIFSVISKYKYHIKLVEEGGDIKAHKKARFYKLMDPFWWLSLHRYPVDKIKSVIYSKLLQGG